MIVQLLVNDLGVYYLIGLLFMLVVIGDIAHNPYADRMLGNPHPAKYVLVVVAFALVWPYVLAEMVSDNDRGRH